MKKFIIFDDELREHPWSLARIYLYPIIFLRSFAYFGLLACTKINHVFRKYVYDGI